MKESHEVWKSIKGYDGVYQVSNLGNVRSFKKGRWGISTTPTLLRGLTNVNYRYVCLSKNRVKTFCAVHRLVAETFLDNPDNLNCVNHIDGNKLNNNVNNLEWCTQKHNMEHASRLGLMKSKKVRNKKTGEIFNSITAAAKDYGTSQPIMSQKLHREMEGFDYEIV